MFNVSIKAVLQDGEGRVLLLKNDRDEWELPGGRIEIGESPQETVVREIAEEVGLQCSVDCYLDSYLFEVLPGRFVFIETFACRPLDTPGTTRLSDEHIEAGWFDPDGLPARLPDGYRQSIRRQLERTHQPISTGGTSNSRAITK